MKAKRKTPTPLDRAIEVMGGISKLAAAIGERPNVVSNWRMRGGNVPERHCASIEIATHGAVTRRDFHPTDWQRIWPELAEKAAA